MRTQKIFILLSIFAGGLMAAVSLIGIIDAKTYQKETANWTAQAVGQDIVNLALAFPILIISAALVLRRNSFRAFLVWLGVLLYMIYSYILYSLFLHFGPLFLLYAAILGLSFYAFAGGLICLDWQWAGKSTADVRAKPASILLATVAIMFSLLWLVDIIGALKRGGVPQDLERIGFWVNPIHVLDLSFLLPGALIVSVLLLRKKTLGQVLAVPFLAFFALMGAAIICMIIAISQKGFEPALPQAAAVGGIVVASSIIAGLFLKGIRHS